MEWNVVVQTSKYAIVQLTSSAQVSAIANAVTIALGSHNAFLHDCVCVVDRLSSVLVFVHQATLLSLNTASLGSHAPRRFPVPVSDGELVSEHVCLVHNGTQDPGLLFCSPSGEIRFWESASYSPQDAFRSLHLGLTPGDRAVSITSAEPAGFVVATRFGSLFQIFLVTATGQPGLSYSQLSRPVGMLARFGSMLGIGGEDHANSPVRVVVQAPEAGLTRKVFLLTNKNLQKWVVLKNAPEKFVFEHNVHGILSLAVATDLLNHSQGLRFLGDFTLKDMAISRDQGMVFLAAFYCQQLPGNEETVVHCLVVVLPQENLKVKRIIYLNHRSTEINERLTLSLMNDGPVILVHTASFVILQSLLTGFEEEQIYLKKRDDRILGCDATNSSNRAVLADRAGMATLFCTVSGLLHIEVARPKVAATGQAEMGSQADRLKQALVNHLLYGDDNPVRIDLTQAAPTELAKIVEDISLAILSSDAYVFPAPSTVTDVKEFLGERLSRSERLVEICATQGDSAYLGPGTMAVLYRASELFHAARALWQSPLSPSNPEKAALWKKVPSLFKSDHADFYTFLRPYFTHQVESLGLLIHRMVEHCASPDGQEKAFSDFAADVTSIIVSALWESDERLSQKVGNDPAVTLSVPHSWLITKTFLQNLGVWAEKLPSNSERRATMVHIIVWGYQDRFSSSFMNVDDAMDASVRALSGLSVSQPQVALNLAERYLVFPALVAICLNKEPTDLAQIHRYHERFGDQFDVALFAFCRDNSKMAELFQLPDSYNASLDRFLRDLKRPEWSWIHDIRQEKFKDAHNNLKRVASDTGLDLPAKKIILSLEKLTAYAAAIHSDNRLDDVLAQEEAVKRLPEPFPDCEGLRGPTRKWLVELAGRAKTKPLSARELVDLLSLLPLVDHTASPTFFLLALEVATRSQDKKQLLATTWRRILLIDGWADFKSSVDATLQGLLSNSEIARIVAELPPALRGDAFVLLTSPQELQFTEEMSAFTASLPGSQGAEMEALYRDFQLENKDLGAVIADHPGQHSFLTLIHMILKQ